MSHEITPLPGSLRGNHALCGQCRKPAFRIVWPGNLARPGPWQHATRSTVGGRCALGDHSLCLTPDPASGCPGFIPAGNPGARGE